MLFQPPGPAKRPSPALLSRPRMMLSQLAGSPDSTSPAVVLQELATCRACQQTSASASSAVM